jgi:hypothetical protein
MFRILSFRFRKKICNILTRKIDPDTYCDVRELDTVVCKIIN